MIAFTDSEASHLPPWRKRSILTRQNPCSLGSRILAGLRGTQTPAKLTREPPTFVGYARVSTHHQIVARQVDAFRKAGCGRIFIDHGVTGMTLDRQELQAALTWMRRDDIPTIVSLDRLGRSVRGVLALVDDLEERGVGLRVLQLGLNTSTPGGRLVLTVLLAVAQLEEDHLSERTRDGLAAARRCEC